MRIRSLILVVLVTTLSIQSSYASTLSDLSHIHSIKVQAGKILLGTHEGLFTYLGKGKIRQISNENFDVMGLSINSESMYASGHPGPGSQLPEPIGLLKSIDGGKKWQKVSLQGEVDFHLLESKGRLIYGGDSGSGRLYYSTNMGGSWNVLGSNHFQDISINPENHAHVLAVEGGRLIYTKDNFRKSRTLDIGAQISQIEWSKRGIFASSYKNLLYVKELGGKWRSITKLAEDILMLSVEGPYILLATASSLYLSKNYGKKFNKI